MQPRLIGCPDSIARRPGTGCRARRCRGIARVSPPASPSARGSRRSRRRRRRCRCRRSAGTRGALARRRRRAASRSRLTGCRTCSIRTFARCSSRRSNRPPTSCWTPSARVLCRPAFARPWKSLARRISRWPSTRARRPTRTTSTSAPCCRPRWWSLRQGFAARRSAVASLLRARLCRRLCFWRRQLSRYRLPSVHRCRLEAGTTVRVPQPPPWTSRPWRKPRLRRPSHCRCSAQPSLPRPSRSCTPCGRRVGCRLARRPRMLVTSWSCPARCRSLVGTT
mmetsp:Transcript_13112/g.46618  ORF Transcript_13112/g.46618 Transcript_13112/m.46618 type:complete len:280 (+) Transcript_13112:192-1031(+)